MSQQPQPPRQEPGKAEQGVSNQSPAPPVTRAGVVWTAVVVALVVLILLIVFFLQNQDSVRVYFLGLGGYVPLGLALFIAAVAGGVLVAVAGAVRILQLRLLARRSRRTTPPTAAKR
ncbi:lipopolysaccharide assembly protein LapA domain-containing protein [Arthrobacter sp. NyZ413]|uniref:lipopolysaccharide assembly protein LapA domain-containing protein n=1 Tax=Arthrobacter sp. NyZ413 TaxID=3144669 RepID=UPI003BF810F5